MEKVQPSTDAKATAIAVACSLVQAGMAAPTNEKEAVEQADIVGKMVHKLLAAADGSGRSYE